MNNRAQSRGSAAWIVGIVAVLGFLIGAILLSATDPVMQALFDSSLWTADTSQGSDLLSWQHAVWGFIPAAILLALVFEIWISTRQPT